MLTLGAFETVIVPELFIVAARALFIVAIFRVPPAATEITEVALGVKLVTFKTPPLSTLIVAPAPGVKLETVIVPLTFVVDVLVGE